MYPPFGYTRWAGVVPESTRRVPEYPISHPIGYPGSLLPGYGGPIHDGRPIITK